MVSIGTTAIDAMAGARFNGRVARGPGASRCSRPPAIDAKWEWATPYLSCVFTTQILPASQPRRGASPHASAGVTLVELLVALALLAIVGGIVIPRVQDARDRMAVRGATSELVSVLALARGRALASQSTVAIRIDTSLGTATVFAGTDTLLTHSFRATQDVQLDVTRDSIAFASTGRGYGASNARIIIRRGAAMETTTVARLGRVRHSP
jgi:prepilin-type N-terminal cleavage/methylation domain-containing protein